MAVLRWDGSQIRIASKALVNFWKFGFLELSSLDRKQVAVSVSPGAVYIKAVAYPSG